ncbi:hypothetical protein LCGC14_0042960 [marine sediment metagenome]|uniref:Uncharacterized protein n=1 Tax=marine sediment metagenome TaxID=412755 RepID=A0A0F9W7V9_9ZZZZ
MLRTRKREIDDPRTASMEVGSAISDACVAGNHIPEAIRGRIINGYIPTPVRELSCE